MAGALTGRTKPTKVKKLQRAQKRKRSDVDVEKLQQAVDELDPKGQEYKSFTDLPLSEPTKAGLKSCHFAAMTDIQTRAIPLALKGADILGAAKTGSGKTLAFVVPVLENLYRSQCVGPDAGLGAMIISPTRELAIQIFEVLYNIGKKGHLFSAGLVIGGKSLQEERDALVRMNIVVCTPGRMLQHLSQTVGFFVDNLQMLVLDEADRILDMGFQRDLDAIIDYLPKQRQTLLFSATQTKKVSDLARLSLQDPEYVSVHESAETATPKSLQQNYVITPLSEKLDTLWSFIQASKKSKIIVFLSSGKQVRFVYESFRHMQPGIPLLHLHGRQKQTARLDITKKFSAAKQSCLFATDVAARGLDFPAVDWVVQVDCPEDADTYIHRVGRTARYERDGRAVLFLDPSEEEGMLKRLEARKIPIERINVRTKKQQSIKNQLQNMCFKDAQLKYLGQKAFISYVKSIHVQKDKEIFQLQKLPLEEFAASLGLPGAPRIKFMKGDNAKELKNAPRHGLSSSEDESSEDDGGKKRSKKEKEVRTKYDRMFERKNQDVLSEHYTKLVQDELSADDKDNRPAAADESEDDFMAVKRRIPAMEGDADSAAVGMDGLDADGKKVVKLPGAKEPILIDSKRREKELKSKKKLLRYKEKGHRVVFDDEGNPHELYEMEDEEAFKAKGSAEEQRRRFVEEEKQRVEEADAIDRDVAREKRMAKKIKRKERERAERLGHDVEASDEGEEEGGVSLGGVDGDAFNDFKNFLAETAGDRSDGEESGMEEEGEERPSKKRAKKWFEDESSEDEDDGKKKKKSKKGKKRSENVQEEPETLEDLEALAAGVLGE
ncbi:RNA helicase ATP-dependent DEAD-box conserved site [Macrophomina phaseolina MS6]|uniref:ATP-dependent RNA helicase n=1 Tax=Macrophomina phaseolina (strain MS6) TaxID=1126212 RepID=K2RAS8_MACPH|nr:RNA helicase ATP-dependent DEAD-box conserved site [Macrophomina phaseolina MS6]